MRIHGKYKNLFKLNTRYCIITGGRGSGKSFALSVRLLMNTYDVGKTILFTRYTMTSAEISIIPEFWEKVEMLGLEDVFYRTKNSIVNKETGSTILFRGLKSSSGKQTANLKSINNITTWVLDEAEEMTDEVMFDKIDLSVRKKDSANEVILCLNPTDNKNHFIYRKFFKGYGLLNVYNGITNDCTFIHTDYRDNVSNLSESFLTLANICKAGDEEKYNNIYLGFWGELGKGIIFKDWKEGDFPSHLPCWYGVDWGFTNDPTAVVRVAYDKDLKMVYLYEVLYRKEQQPRDVARAIRMDYRGKKTDIWQLDDKFLYTENGNVVSDQGTQEISEYLENPLFYKEHHKAVNDIWNIYTDVYCDPARPEHISELRNGFNISAHGAANANKEGRINFLKYFEVYYQGKNIREEVTTWEWMADKHDSKVLTNTPKDGGDHAMDAILYGAVSHLRRLGVINNIGEK